MRNISFALTTEQIIDRSKTVTRRTGWKDLKPGTLLSAVRKGMGLKKGENIERLCTIRVVDVRREPLKKMLSDYAYGVGECIREGFPLMLPGEFVGMFLGSHDCNVHEDVTRIEFEYV